MKSLFCVSYSNVSPSDLLISKSDSSEDQEEISILNEFYSKKIDQKSNSIAYLLTSKNGNTGFFKVKRNLNGVHSFCQDKQIILGVRKKFLLIIYLIIKKESFKGVPCSIQIVK